MSAVQNTTYAGEAGKQKLEWRYSEVIMISFLLKIIYDVRVEPGSQEGGMRAEAVGPVCLGVWCETVSAHIPFLVLILAAIIVFVELPPPRLPNPFFCFPGLSPLMFDLVVL